MQYDEIFSFMINKLETGLPVYLTYHNVHHTKAVIAAAEHLAKQEHVAGDDLILLKTAALFHDTGFLQHHHDHEELSCKIAQQHLPGYGYTSEQIEIICRMIMATKLPQAPVDHLGQLICDADLFYLGGNQYTANAENLFKEYKKLGIVGSHAAWELKQADFLSAHHYFTQSAIKERESQKQKALEEIRSKLATTLGPHKKPGALEILQDIIFMIIGVIMAGFALKGFLVPNSFFDGGITGLSLLVHELYHFNLGIVIILLNLPLIIISIFSVGRSFALKTFLSVLMLGAALVLLPDYALTQDKLLISIFGGVFLGIGIGLIMRAGAALDGIEVLALYTLKRTSFTISEIILGINILIFTIAAFKFGIETALYSILTYFAATRSIDYVVEGIQAYTGVTIISGKSEVIKYQLVNSLGRGITVYKGERGFLPGKYDVSADCDIIFTVITRLELRKLKNLVYEVDPQAFVFANTIKEASGGVIKRRSKH
ncbi:MAG: YitT family protein [Ferruginibacter sp.]